MRVLFPAAIFILLLYPAAYSQRSDDFIKLGNREVKVSGRSPFIHGRTIVSDIEFTGLDIDLEEYGVSLEDPLYETTLRRVFKPSDLADGQKFNASKTESILKKTKEWLQVRGFPLAEVTAYGTMLADGRMRLRFAVLRGPLVKTFDIDFVGNERVTDQELIDDFKICSGNNWEVYEERKYEYYSQRCSRQLMFSKGFWKAKVLGVSTRVTPTGRSVKIKLEEGPRYRIGEIKIEGAVFFSEWEIRASLGQNTGDIADGRKLQNFVFETMKQKYFDNGFLHYNAEFEPDLNEPEAKGMDGIVNVRLLIDEGKQFRVRKISFGGTGRVEEEILKAEFLLNKGDIYTHSKLVSWVEKINSTCRFYFLDKDQHVELLTDDEAGTVDINILIRKKTPP